MDAGSPSHWIMPCVFGPVVYQEHLAGTAAHLQLQRLVGVNFPFPYIRPLVHLPRQDLFAWG